MLIEQRERKLATYGYNPDGILTQDTSAKHPALPTNTLGQRSCNRGDGQRTHNSSNNFNTSLIAGCLPPPPWFANGREEPAS